MSIQTNFEFNRDEQCVIVSPDFLQLTDAKIDTDAFIESGIFVDINGALCTIEKSKKWHGLVTESNFYNTSTGKMLKPSGNVVAYFGDIRFITKIFTDNADAPIQKGDLLTIINGKPAKTDENHTVPVLQCIYRDSDYIECVTI
jgi:hypothetical protein